tara:strand:- start:72311 stop:73210 length:900 start_codon:yes stop_codon:yes gene_type:complete
MEFGRVENLTKINSIQWNLPSEDPLTRPFLSAQAASIKKTKFYIGAPAWSHKEWVGRIYPPKTPASEYLFYYSRNFNCIELNTTHYRIPTTKNVSTWVSKVPNDFHFLPKIPQAISHDQGGLRDVQTLGAWIKAIDGFGLKLGPCFLQLPPTFSYAYKLELFHFLKSWPDTYELAIELRHPSWFQDGHVFPPLVEYLQGRGIGLVITDVAGRRDVLHSSVSAPFSTLRLIGNNLHSTDFDRAKLWSLKINEWQEMGLKQFYFIVHQPDDIKTPEMTDWVIDDLNAVCAAGLAPLVKPLI